MAKSWIRRNITKTLQTKVICVATNMPVKLGGIYGFSIIISAKENRRMNSLISLSNMGDSVRMSKQQIRGGKHFVVEQKNPS